MGINARIVEMIFKQIYTFSANKSIFVTFFPLNETPFIYFSINLGVKSILFLKSLQMHYLCKGLAKNKRQNT